MIGGARRAGEAVVAAADSRPASTEGSGSVATLAGAAPLVLHPKSPRPGSGGR